MIFRSILILLFSFLVSPLYGANFNYPVNGKIIRDYVKNKTDGIDISAPEGTPVVAAEIGVVAAITAATAESKKPSIIVLKHKDKILTVYGGLGEIIVKEKEKVFRGQTIGKVGSGNPSFLHFEVRKGFQPLDPMDFLKKEQNLTVADNSDCNKATTELGRTVCNAAEQGNAKQQFGLGELYYYGEGLAKDFSKAVYWYTKAAEQDITRAQYKLGLMYYNGNGIVQDLKKAEYWFTQAAKDDLYAQIMLESIQFEKPYKLLKSGHYLEASKEFKLSAGKGNTISFLYRRADIFLSILTGSTTYEEYLQNHRNICEKLENNFLDYLKLWYDHAPLYAARALCSTDKVESANFLKKANLWYDPFAKFLRGFTLQVREDASPSLYKNRIFYSESALFGYCPAMIFLSMALMEEDPEGIVEKDINTAYAWVIAAQKFGCPHVPSIGENDFDNSEHQKFVEQIAAELLERMEKKKAELKVVNFTQDVHKNYNVSDVPEGGLMGRPKGAIDGVVLSELTDSLRDEYGLDLTLSGVLVTSVDEKSFAYKNNLRKGDLITDVTMQPVKSVEDVAKLISNIKSDGRQSILLLVRRDGQSRFIVLKVYQ